MRDRNDPRWLAATHEAGHIVGMMGQGIWPDGAKVCSLGSGMVHQFAPAGVWEFVMSEPTLRHQQAIVSISGYVAEADMLGYDTRICAFTGDTADFDRIAELGFNEDDRFALQREASDLLAKHARVLLRLSRLLYDLGNLHRDDLVDVWFLTKQEARHV